MWTARTSRPFEDHGFVSWAFVSADNRDTRGVGSHPSRLLGDGCTRICASRALRSPLFGNEVMLSVLRDWHIMSTLLSFTRFVWHDGPARVCSNHSRSRAEVVGIDPDWVNSVRRGGDSWLSVRVLYLLIAATRYGGPLLSRERWNSVSDQSRSVSVRVWAIRAMPALEWAWSVLPRTGLARRDGLDLWRSVCTPASAGGRISVLLSDGASGLLERSVESHQTLPILGTRTALSRYGSWLLSGGREPSSEELSCAVGKEMSTWPSVYAP